MGETITRDMRRVPLDERTICCANCTFASLDSQRVTNLTIDNCGHKLGCIKMARTLVGQNSCNYFVRMQ